MFFVWNTIFVSKKYFPTLTFVWCCFVMQLNRRRFVFYPAALFWYFTVLFCTCCRCHSSCCLFWYLQKKNPIAFAAGERFVVWNQHCTRLRSDICVKTKENQIWNAADDRIKRRNWGESLYGFLPVWQKEGEERDAGRRERRRNNNDEQARERLNATQPDLPQRCVGGEQHRWCGENNPSWWMAIQLTAGQSRSLSESQDC